MTDKKAKLMPVERWTPPATREQRMEEQMAYSSIPGGYWCGVFRSGKVVVGGPAEEVVRLPDGAAEAILACHAFAQRLKS